MGGKVSGKRGNMPGRSAKPRWTKHRRASGVSRGRNLTPRSGDALLAIVAGSLPLRGRLAKSLPHHRRVAGESFDAERQDPGLSDTQHIQDEKVVLIAVTLAIRFVLSRQCRRHLPP